MRGHLKYIVLAATLALLAGVTMLTKLPSVFASRGSAAVEPRQAAPIDAQAPAAVETATFALG